MFAHKKATDRKLMMHTVIRNLGEQLMLHVNCMQPGTRNPYQL